MLEVIETSEALQETAQRKATALQQAEETWQKENAAMAIEHREQLEGRKQETQARRTAYASGIDAALLSRYEAIRRTKQGRAVSKVEQSSCQWCRGPFDSPASYSASVSIMNYETCSNCGRILYYRPVRSKPMHLRGIGYAFFAASLMFGLGAVLAKVSWATDRCDSRCGAEPLHWRSTAHWRFTACGNAHLPGFCLRSNERTGWISSCWLVLEQHFLSS